MGWSVALACASIGDPVHAFCNGLSPDPDAAAALARRLYPDAVVVERGDTVLDFALWPYEDELFVGVYGRALVVCDRRLFGVDDDARRLADQIAGALPGATCGVLVLHSVMSGCWFRWYEHNRLLRDVFVTAEDGVVVASPQPVAPGRLVVAPPDRQLRDRTHRRRHDGAVAHGGSEHDVPTPIERVDQRLQAGKVDQSDLHEAPFLSSLLSLQCRSATARGTGTLGLAQGPSGRGPSWPGL